MTAAVETVAIIVYKQPITAAQLQAIRGVRNSETLRTLLKRKIIAPAGRARTHGHPVQYKTTRRFLIEFGLHGLDELPFHRRIAAASGLPTRFGIRLNNPFPPRFSDQSHKGMHPVARSLARYPCVA